MELLVRVRWRHVPAADLRIEVEPYHTVGDLLGAASEFCDGNWDASQPLYLERSGEPSRPRRADHRERHRLRRHAALRALRSRPARPRVAVGGGELRRHGRTGGGPLVRAAARAARGRHGRRAPTCTSTTSPCRTTSCRSSSYDDLVTRLVPDPAATNPVVVNGHPIVRCHRRRSQRRRPVRRHRGRASRLQPDVRQRARPTRPGAVPAHAVQAGRRPEARVQADRQCADEAGAAPVFDDHDDAAVGRRAGDVRGVPLADVPDDDACCRPCRWRGSCWDSRKSGSQQVRRVDRDVPRPAWRSARPRSSRPCSTSAPNGSTSRPTSPTSPAGRRCARSTCGLGSAATTSSCGPASASAPSRRRSPSSRRPPARSTCERRRRRRSPATTSVPACPICVNLAELGVFGLHGELADVRAMCSSIILQAVTLHSPEDLVLVVVEGEPQGLGCVGEVAAAHPLGDVADLGRPRRRGRRRRRRHDPRARLGRQAAHERRRPRRSPVAVDPRHPRRERRRRRRPRIAAPRPVPSGRNLGRRRRRVRCPRASPGQGDDGLRPADRRDAGAVHRVVHRPGRRA